jgi:hypothetical protein
MIACKTCKFFDIGGTYEPPTCQHKTCWSEAEVDPINGTRLMRRILNYHNKNGNGDCQDFIQKKSFLELLWKR